MDNNARQTNVGSGGKLPQRDSFGSKLGIIAAAAGSAIGLGNIWKFPYITGIFGGGAFLVVYLAFILLIGVGVMLAEFLIGRMAQRNAVGSFRELKPNSPWQYVGWMGVIAAFMILAYYGVVAGWTLSYIFKAIMNAFEGLDPDGIGTLFNNSISEGLTPILWQIGFMAIVAWVVIAGVKDGIEKYSKILMPLLLVIIVILDIRAVTLPGASAGLEFLFKPDFSKLTGDGILSALGHAFFSLSLGMGTMITYGSYIGKKENLGVTALQVSIADTLIALLAGIAIFPAVFAFGIATNSGPGLVFVTLPNVFQKMPGGYIFAIMFFVLLAVAALTSAISILEVVVAYFTEDLNISRKKATIISTVGITAAGVLTSLAQGPLADVKLFGLNFFDLFDWITANLLLPLGGLFICLFVGWILSPQKVKDELSNNGEISIPYFGAFMIIMKIVAPAGIAVVFLHGIGMF